MVPHFSYSLRFNTTNWLAVFKRITLIMALAVLAFHVGVQFAFANKVTKLANISYGQSAQQKLDIYLPATPNNAPILFFIHGGAWQFGNKANKKSVENKIARWVPKGFIFVSANYRLAPLATPYQQAQDILRALTKVQNMANQLNGDASNIVVIGHSAGAHLSALASASTFLHKQHKTQPWLATILIDSASYDIEKIMNRRHHKVYDKVFGNNAGQWKLASPFAALKFKTPPLLAVCSTLRMRVCPATRAFINKAKTFGTHATVLPVRLSHKELNQNLGANNAYTNKVEAFLKSLSHNIAQRLEP